MDSGINTRAPRFMNMRNISSCLKRVLLAISSNLLVYTKKINRVPDVIFDLKTDTDEYSFTRTARF